jgi:hypothetical protein
VTWPNDVVTRTVTGTFLTSLGAAAKGRVTFTPTSRIVDEEDAVIIEDTQSVVLNAQGAFSIELPTTDNVLLYPSGWAYKVSIRIYGVKPQQFHVFLPVGDGSSVDLNVDLISSNFGVAPGAGSPQAAPGPMGPRGPGVIVGTGVPTSVIGQDGDIYIDDDNGYFYGPKASGTWPGTSFYSPAGTQRYVHTQTSASTTWTITHTLGGRPSVTIVDSAGTVVVGEVGYNSDTTVVVSFTSAFSGFAYLT